MGEPICCLSCYFFTPPAQSHDLLNIRRYNSRLVIEMSCRLFTVRKIHWIELNIVFQMKETLLNKFIFRRIL